MHVLITGANGFIGRNLCLHLKEMKDIVVLEFTRDNTASELTQMCSEADVVVHLAGVNRPKNDEEFSEGNDGLTSILCNILSSTGRKIPIILSSSIQAEKNNPYGKSKLASEDAVTTYSTSTGSRVHIYRLPNVFGKWCKPNYNSVVATFCYNIANDLPIKIDNPNAEILLVYIDDVVKEFVSVLFEDKQSGFSEVAPVYSIKLSELAEKIKDFKESRQLLAMDHVGLGLTRALYATYLSCLRPERFLYDLVKHEDERGGFVEILKTKDSGQFSFFTSNPGATRGEHYHHTKNEKFLVIAGNAKFRFCNVLTEEKFEIKTSGNKPQVVESVPGWAHDITNIGDCEMVVMLWANEIFDKNNPDTYVHKIK